MGKVPDSSEARPPSGWCAACGVRVDPAGYVGIGHHLGRRFVFVTCTACGDRLTGGDVSVGDRIDARFETAVLEGSAAAGHA